MVSAKKYWKPDCCGLMSVMKIRLWNDPVGNVQPHSNATAWLLEAAGVVLGKKSYCLSRLGWPF